MTESEFLKLINQYWDTIDKVCRLFRNKPQDQEDLLQETLLRAWKSRHTFEGRCPFEAWLYKVARNTALDALRKEKKDLIRYTTMLPDIPDESAESAERSEQLAGALKQLKDEERTLISLYMDDQSYKEIGESVGTSENNVGVRLNRIKIKIQKLLKIRQ